MVEAARTSVVLSGSFEDTSQGSPRSTRQHAFVNVSATLYVACWWGVLSMHVFTAVIVLYAGFVHLILSIDTFDRATSAIGIPVPLKRITGCGYLVVTFLHIRAVKRLVSQSLRAKRLTLQPVTRSQAYRHSSASVASIQIPKPVSRTRRLYSYLSRAQDKVLGPDGYVGINGPYFTSALLVRETIEVAMQTYQLWTLSYSVSRVWINVLAVVTVVLNCVSIPVVHVFFKRNIGRQRLMYLVVDMYLDFTCAVVVPLCILLPYLLQFDWSTNQYPFELLLDDVWFANAIAEARQVLVTSYLDLFSSLLPQYSIYSCLRLIKRLVKRKPTEERDGKQPKVISPPPQTETEAEIATKLKAKDTTMETESLGVRLVTTGIAMWAIAVLGFHFHANRFAWRPEYQGCRLYVRPWLAKNISCSVMQVNCYRWNTTGSAHDMASILDPLQRSALGKLIIVHCTGLTIPSKLVEFQHLNVFVNFNNTVVDWPAEAAIRQATHPMMSDIYFTLCNMSEMPTGLFHDDLPRSMRLVGFYSSSLSELPTNLGDLWASTGIVRIGLQYTPIQAIPMSLGRMRSLQRLWMVGIPIVSFPENVFANSAFVSIRLSAMPLQSLPNTAGDTSKLTELMVEYTNVSDLPAWVTEWLDAHSSSDDKAIRSFYGSPVCDQSNDKWKEKVVAWRICEQDRQSRYGEFPVGALDNHFLV